MKLRNRELAVLLVLSLSGCAGPIRGVLNGDPDSVVHPKMKPGGSTNTPPVVEPVVEVDVTEEEAVRLWGEPLASPASRP